MAFLHVADSASHIGASWVSVLVAGAGIAAGALFVFGMPSILQRRRTQPNDGTASDEPGDNTFNPLTLRR